MKPTCRELVDRAYEREAGVVLAARVERVLARHVSYSEDDAQWCQECGMLWPCPTVRLFDGAEA